MALFNEIQIGRLNGVLHKLLGMKEGAPSPQLSGDIVPALILESDRPEWKFLAGERLCMGGGAGAGVVGELRQFQIHNPADSGVLCVIKQMICTCDTSGPIFWGHADVPYSTLGGAQLADGFRDSRLSRGVLDTTCDVFTLTDAAVAIVSIIGRTKILNNLPTVLRFPVILTPGHGFAVAFTVANEPFQTTWEWTERLLEESETR